MKLEPFIEPSALVEIAQGQKISTPKFLFRFVEDFLLRLNSLSPKLTFGAKIPYEWLEYNKSVWSALALLEELKASKIVRRWYLCKETFPDEPRCFIFVIELTGKHPLGFKGIGRDMSAVENAIWPAIGEAIERWSINTFYPSKRDIINSSANSLRNRAVSIENLAGFSEKLRNEYSGDFTLQYDSDTEFTWTRAQLLKADSESEVWAPLQWFSYSHVRHMKETNEPLLSPPVTTGIATGKNRIDATYRGILENIERDAFMIYWMNSLVPNSINPDSIEDETVLKQIETIQNALLEIHLLHLKTDIPAHTVLALIIDKTGVGPAITVNACSDLKLINAVRHSIDSAVGLRIFIRDLMNQCKSHAGDEKAVRSKDIDHLKRMLYWASPKRIEFAKFLLHGETLDTSTLSDFGDLEADDPSDGSALKFLLDHFENAGMDVISKEIFFHPDKAHFSPVTTVATKIPKLQPLHLEETLKADSGKRMKYVPALLNQKAFPNPAPHPFT